MWRVLCGVFSPSAKSMNTEVEPPYPTNIDYCVQGLESDWYELVREEHREMATKLVREVDWAWVHSVPRYLQGALPLYQLFLLCKFVARDFNVDPVIERLSLSPTGWIDALWHEHILRVHKYLAMHTTLLGSLENVLDHTPESVHDSEEEKQRRMAALHAQMLSLVPSLGELDASRVFSADKPPKC